MIASWQESYDNPRQCVKKAKTSLCHQNLYSQGYGLSSSLVQMWELDYKEGWVPKKWCFRTAGLEMTLESPLENKEIKPVNPQGSQPWILFGRTDAEAPVLWPPDENSQLIGKDPDAGKDWRQKEKRATEDEMVRWHHWFSGHELGQTLGDGEGQESLASCSLWCLEESDTTWLQNKNSWWICDFFFVCAMFVCVSVCLFCWGMWDLSSQTRDRVHFPLQWILRVLTSGPPGKSRSFFLRWWKCSEIGGDGCKIWWIY